MDLIYVETTVIGNVAGRIHSNPDVASRQRATSHSAHWPWVFFHFSAGEIWLELLEIGSDRPGLVCQSRSGRTPLSRTLGVAFAIAKPSPCLHDLLRCQGIQLNSMHRRTRNSTPSVAKNVLLPAAFESVGGILFSHPCAPADDQ
jgi:hypothetical protein